MTGLDAELCSSLLIGRSQKTPVRNTSPCRRDKEPRTQSWFIGKQTLCPYTLLLCRLFLGYWLNPTPKLLKTHQSSLSRAAIPSPRLCLALMHHWCSDCSEWQHGSHLAKSWHMDLTAFPSMYYDTNIIPCLLLLLGFHINTRLPESRTISARRTAYTAPANKWLLGPFCDLAWKTEAEFKREIAVPSNIDTQVAPAGLNWVLDALCHTEGRCNQQQIPVLNSICFREKNNSFGQSKRECSKRHKAGRIGW